MNAHELADKLKEDVKSTVSFDSSLSERIIQASFLLHQQADRISVLEAINEKAFEYINHLEQGLRASIDLNKAQANRGAEHGSH